MRVLEKIARASLAAVPLFFVMRYAVAQNPAGRERGERSEIVYPQQQLPLRFSHARHLGPADLQCMDCHTKIARSDSALDNNLPAESVCAECHTIDRSKASDAACGTCHLGFDAKSGAVQRADLGLPRLKFSHKRHLARGTLCKTCHGDLLAGGVALATRDHLPTMETCLGCHDGREASSQCTTCHLTEVGGIVRTRYPEGELRPGAEMQGAVHDVNFRTTHRFAAQNNQRLCASCHKKEFCVDCHDGVMKPMDFHAGDYVRLHAIDARRNQPDCSTCHRQQSFCVGCHSRTGVAADGKGSEFSPPSAGPGGQRFHPSGWVEFAPSLVQGERGPNHHAFEAQRNIRQCTSCHRESFCTQCHSAQVGSYGINPHPRSWLGSSRCRALVQRASRMCLRCHTRRSEVDCDRPGVR
jgi:c(7)-type cytochrome triheme protein